MRKLWIFGDSLSVGFNSFIPNKLYDKRDWWSTHLGNKLGCDEVINTAGAGNDRLQILHKWLTNWNDIDSNDIVIYQIGFKDRYNLQPLNINALDIADYIFEQKGNGTNDINSILENHWSGAEWGYELFNKVVLNWGKDKQIYFWNMTEDWQEYKNLPNKLHSPNGSSSVWEGWLNQDDKLWIWHRDGWHDKHFNQEAHIKLAESFYKQING